MLIQNSLTYFLDSDWYICFKVFKSMKKLISLLAIIIATTGCSQNTLPTHTTVQPKEFQEAITQSTVQLVDVRTPPEFQEGIISGAINMDYKSADFEEKIQSLDKTQPVYIYCLGGGRSKAASEVLVQKGYTVIELDGGVMNWRNSDLPMEGAESKSDEITNFDQIIAANNIVVVDFYADWCVPCKKMKPSLDKLDQVEGVTVVRINADNNPALCKKERVTALPVVQYYKGGKLIKREEGFVSEEQLFKNVKGL